jgi:hypothetical protein
MIKLKFSVAEIKEEGSRPPRLAVLGNAYKVLTRPTQGRNDPSKKALKDSRTSQIWD